MPFLVDIQFIKETEKELNVVFPPLFTAKMVKLNGGEVSTEDDDWQLYPFFDKSDNKRISRTCNHIGLETKSAKEWGNFPHNVIAIGRNGCDDHLILLPEQELSTELADTIYIWRHETGDIEMVAASIDALSCRIG